jgi:Phytanoyl-CoA dioxygenase (PhyH)
MATKSASSVLTGEQREQFDRDGFLTFDPEISDEVLDRVLKDVGERYDFEGTGETIDDYGVKYMSGPNPRITYAWKISDAVKQVALAPKVIAILEELYGHRPIPFQTLNFMNGTEQHVHVDGMYFNSEPLGWMCGVWVALEDIDMDNGPLVYYPGTHKLPLPTWEDLGALEPSQFESYDEFIQERARRYDRHIEKQISEYEGEPQYGTIRRGEALVWAAHLMHGGSPQRDRNRTRHSQVTHYYFEGDFRHTWPLRRERDRIYWDYPGWVGWDTPPKLTPEVVRETIEATVPAGATALVATGGTAEMLDLRERQGLHFPQQEGGEHLHYLEISGPEMVEQLEQLRTRGARYLVFPGSESLWLSNVLLDLSDHLDEHYRTILRDGSTCIIYELN